MSDYNAEFSESLEDRLDKIRLHGSSKLSHQKQLAIILSAVEENLEEEKTDKTAASYFVSFLSLIDQSFTDVEVQDKDMAAASLYMLDLIAPYTSQGLLRSKFADILNKIAPAFIAEDVEGPLLRSCIGILETLLISQDHSSWSLPSSQSTPTGGIKVLLALSLDPRPKVRKRAQDAITKVLKNPPPSPSVEHPASVLCAEIALKSVQAERAAVSSKNSKPSLKDQSANDRQIKLIHALQLVRAITNANSWPMAKVDVLCQLLFAISKTSDQYLVVTVFDVFEAIFRSVSDEVDAGKLVTTLDAIFELKPAVNDQLLAPAWLAVVAQSTASYANLQPSQAFARLPAIFSTVIEFLQSENDNINTSAAQCIVALISTSIPTKLLVEAKNKQTSKTLSKLASQVQSLLTVQYQASRSEIMQIISTFFDVLRQHSDPYLISCLEAVTALRQEDQKDVDIVIAAAIRAIGPVKVLQIMPLNLEKPSPKSPGRAWLLPLLRDNIVVAPLKHFTQYFLPLSERLTAKSKELRAQTGEAAGMQAKIYETLADQIWSLLPRYCDLPIDLQTAVTEDFFVKLSGILYQNVELRSIICQSLRLLVESNVAYSQGVAEDDTMLHEQLPREVAEKNIEYIASIYASKVLSVLFSVFSNTSPEYRNYILEAINAYLSITPEKDVETIFNKVATNLHESLKTEVLEVNNKSGKKLSPTKTLTMMDLVVAMILYLPKSCHNSLLSIFVTTVKIGQEPLVQKKACRILSRLAETEEGKATIKKNLQNIMKLFVDATDSFTSPARGARLAALASLINVLPSDDLYFIPSILSETILSTKDVNEKTREASYSLLVQMGRRMQQGGVVRNHLVPGMGDDAPDTQASLEEYFTMVAAGLAGATPHMVSATITALSRILFEFRDVISTDMLQELSSTVELFLTSNNREIVKSTLGFVKITVISLPVSVVEPSLQQLLENLLVWSHEHNSHFKAKVKHVIERLIRRFGYDVVASKFPEQDIKLLNNIRKSKERAKRQKKDARGDDEEGDKSGKSSGKYSNEFDKVVYGDSSDEEDSEDDDKHASSKKSHRKYIIETGDEPLDLMDKAALAHITSSKPKANNTRTKGKDSFSKGQDGRIVIKENAADEDIDSLTSAKDAISAYVEAVKNGPVRGQRNKLKYKRSRNHDDDEDDGEEENVKAPSKPQRPTKRPNKKFKSRKRL